MTVSWKKIYSVLGGVGAQYREYKNIELLVL